MRIQSTVDGETRLVPVNENDQRHVVGSAVDDAAGEGAAAVSGRRANKCHKYCQSAAFVHNLHHILHIPDALPPPPSAACHRNFVECVLRVSPNGIDNSRAAIVHRHSVQVMTLLEPRLMSGNCGNKTPDKCE